MFAMDGLMNFKLDIPMEYTDVRGDFKPESSGWLSKSPPA